MPLKFVTGDDGLGRPLTAPEIDSNFRDLDTRINDAVDNPPAAASIADITVTGNQLMFLLTDGQEFGPFTLPQAAFQWTGAYQPGYTYPAFSLFTAGNGLYMTTAVWEAPTEFAPDPSVQFLIPYATVYTIGFSYPQQPGSGLPANAAMFSYLADRNFWLPESAGIARVRVAPTDNLTLEVMKNGSVIGAVFVGSGDLTGSVVLSAAVQFAEDDVLRIIRPDDIDSTAIDLCVTLRGTVGLL